MMIWPVTGSRAYVAWAEVSSADRVARYAGLERHLATRSGAVSLPADSFGAYPTSLAGSAYSIAWNADIDRRYLAWEASPFQQVAKLTQGSFTVDSPLQVETTADTVSICNAGTTASREFWLQSQGTVFAVPSIQPGSTWTSSGQPELAAGAMKSPELQLFLNRSYGHALTLLQSLPVSGEEQAGRGWLLRYLSSRAMEVPCGM
jgi:hypothetical protein